MAWVKARDKRERLPAKNTCLVLCVHRARGAEGENSDIIAFFVDKIFENRLMSFFLERKILLSPQDACLIDGDN
jgi:hypothetical protein